MSSKYPRSKHIQHSNLTENAYITWSDQNGFERAMSSLTKAVDEYSGKVHASYGTSTQNIGGSGIHGRHGLTINDYELWRPDERGIFNNVKDTMLAADRCYKHHGLIRNIIDLMGDFACQGIRLVHPNPRIEKFYQNWFDKVNGKERSERFLNYLFRLGNVVIRIQNAKITEEAKQRLFKTMASVNKAKGKPEINIDDLKSKIDPGEIPIKYTFLHPVTVDVVGGPLSNFVGKSQYMIKLPDKLRRLITTPKNSEEKAIVSQLPSDIRQAATKRQGIPLPPDKTRVYHYRKDDWSEWAEPMIGGILLDISLYEKLKLADRAALDGAISNIRIFKLGSLEHKIIPTDRAASKLASILESNTNAGTLDLIWGPDIELVESKTSVHQFLGISKYEPTLLAIYGGVGIPPTLTGTSGASGTTNNFISLKTFIKRLEYGRQILIGFWNEQIRLIQEQMGFRFPAKVEFEYDDLGDETAEKALLIQLADRDLISQEFLQRRFKHDPEMEGVRIQREYTNRRKFNTPNKAGPFHDPQVEDALKKIALQTGIVTPSQVGVELEANKRGEVSMMKMKTSVPTGNGGGKPPAKKGIPQQGRPRNSKDTKKRQTKTFKPKVRASLELWAMKAQSDIDGIINPAFLEKANKKNMRSLSNDESNQIELIKFGILYHLNPFDPIDNSSVYNSLSHKLPDYVMATYKELCNEAALSLDRSLTTDERKYLQVLVYQAFKGDNNG